MPQLEEIASTKVYTIRPFIPSDESEIYEICVKTCHDGTDAMITLPSCPDLVGDCFVGGFLALNAEFCFVVEDDFSRLCGYIVCTPNAKIFKNQLEMSWREEMKRKYPLSLIEPESNRETMRSAVSELIHELHFNEADLDEQVYRKFPALIRMNILISVCDPNVAKRLLVCALSALKMHCVTGVHVPVPIDDQYMRNFFSKLGFAELPTEQQVLKNSVLMARCM